MKRCGVPSVLLVYLRSGRLIHGFKVEAVHRVILSYFRRLYKGETGEEYDDEPEEKESVVNTAEVNLSLKGKLDVRSSLLISESSLRTVSLGKATDQLIAFDFKIVAFRFP